MEDKAKKYKLLCDSVYEIAHGIFDGIVAPACSVPGVGVNIYVAKFADYDNADPKSRNEILEKIMEKYKIDRNALEAMQDYPLALIALYILDQEGKQSQEE